MRRYLAILLLALCLGPALAHGQTLAEVLTAIQNRYLFQDEANAQIKTLNNQAAPISSKIVWYYDATHSLSNPVSEDAVKALTLVQKINLLKQALNYVSQGSYDSRLCKSGDGVLSTFGPDYGEFDYRFQISDYRKTLKNLAQMVSLENMWAWPLKWTQENYNYRDDNYPNDAYVSDYPAAPSWPGVVDGPSSSSISIDSAVENNASLSVFPAGERVDTSVKPNKVIRPAGYDLQGTQTFVTAISGASADWPGKLEIFIQPDYLLSSLEGAFLPPPLSGSSPSPPDPSLLSSHIGPDFNSCTTVSCQPGTPPNITVPAILASVPNVKSGEGGGTWVADSTNQYNPKLFRCIFPDQPTLYTAGPDDFNPYDALELWPLDTMTSQSTSALSYYVADFGTEFPGMQKPTPEVPPLLKLDPDFRKGRLKVSFGNSPANDCQLFWDFSGRNTFSKFAAGTGGGFNDSLMLTARTCLKVGGMGNWDAVYSGNPADREPELDWTYDGPNGDYADFEKYMEVWWNPVLAQLVSPTYGCNITQNGAAGYRIDFYRRDQITDKDSSGRYGFPDQSQAIESFTVTGDHSHLYIATLHDSYAFTLTSSLNSHFQWENSTWELTGQRSGVTFLDKTDVITYYISILNGPQTIVDTTTIDGQTLPKITYSYPDRSNYGAEPFYFDEIVEDAGDDEPSGPRTTTSSYDSGHRIITQSAGVDPQTILEYDDNDLISHYTCGSWDYTWVYDAQTVTCTKKFSGTIVQKEVTTYSPDMTTETTVVTNASNAVSSVVEYYPGDDPDSTPANPWGLKRVLGSDGLLTTYSYAWDGNNFKTIEQKGIGSGTNPTTVTAGTETDTEVNSAGREVSRIVKDVSSGLQLDIETGKDFQVGTPFPGTITHQFGPNESYTYDGEGRVLTHKDQSTQTTTYTWDALDRLTKAIRGNQTWVIEYNPTFLGRKITCGTRVWTEKKSPFGGTQVWSVNEPENITVTRTETADTITTKTQNTTRNQSSGDGAETEVVHKGTLERDITGAATEPWKVTYSVPDGGGLVETLTHGTDSAWRSTVTYDVLGRPTKMAVPSPSGTGTATTTYGYTAGQLTSSTDADGNATTYSDDGTTWSASRGTLSDTVVKSQVGALLQWVESNAAGETTWKQTYDPATAVTVDYPWGQIDQKVTTTPSLGEDGLYTETSVGPGPNESHTRTWTDGALSAGSDTVGAASGAFTATANGFREMTGITGSSGALTGYGAALSTLGLPSSVTEPDGMGATSFTDPDFMGGSFAMTATQNGHSVKQAFWPQGYSKESSGYGVVDTTYSAPSFGATAAQTFTTGAGSQTLTENLAGPLKQRSFTDGDPESFVYTPGGLLTSWVRPGGTLSITTNAFNQPTQIGSLATIGYDLAGRMNSATDASGTHSQSYIHGQPDVESWTSGPLNGLSVDRDYDTRDRLKTVKLPGGFTISYTYDPTNGELAGVTTASSSSASGTAGTWSSFDTKTDRATSLVLGSLTTSASFDAHGRVTSQTGTAGGSSFGYTTIEHDADGHVSRTVAASGATRIYSYDSNGYLQGVTGTPSFSYNFDEAQRSGGQGGGYGPTIRTNLSTVTLVGSVAPGATVAVQNGTTTQHPSVGSDGSFSLLYPTPTQNSWQTYTVVATLAGGGMNGTNAVAQEVRKIFVPPASESLGHDLDWNRASDARWTFHWNELDQLTSAVETSPLSATTAMEIDFTYDVLGRRVQKTVSIGGYLSRSTTTLWDQWRPALEINYDALGDETSRRIYTWGPDVSGTIDGAAGIGGLIEVYEKKAGTTATRSAAVHDGLGNVIALVDESTGTTVAQYANGPFGEPISANGPRSESCPLRWQTKSYDEDLGLYYFGKRWYDPSTHTWLNRDPLREDGGVNLYAYCGDDPVGNFDAIGLQSWSLIQNGNPARVVNGIPQMHYADWAHWWDSIVGGATVDWWQSPTMEELALYFRLDGNGYRLASDYENSMAQTAAFDVDIRQSMVDAGNTIDAVAKIDGGALATVSGAGMVGASIGATILAGHEFWAAGSNWLSLATGQNYPLTPEGEIEKILGRSDTTVNVTDAVVPFVGIVRFQRIPDIAVSRPNVYSVAFETELDPGQFGLSQERHFQIGNQALQAARALNPALEQIVPAPTKWGRPPTGWTWQHATFKQGTDRFGILQLVPRSQHTSGSSFWRLFHPLPGGAGGYKEWAVPAGAPPRR